MLQCGFETEHVFVKKQQNPKTKDVILKQFSQLDILINDSISVVNLIDIMVRLLYKSVYTLCPNKNRTPGTLSIIALNECWLRVVKNLSAQYCSSVLKKCANFCVKSCNIMKNWIYIQTYQFLEEHTGTTGVTAGVSVTSIISRRVWLKSGRCLIRRSSTGPPSSGVYVFGHESEGGHFCISCRLNLIDWLLRITDCVGNYISSAVF